MGDGIEIMGVPEILARWGIQRTDQVVDILGLMGDTSDNIPGVPGVGEKTASKLISQFGTIENLIARSGELKGKMKETIEANRDLALLSKKLATIHCDSPVSLDIEALRLRERNDEAIKKLCVEYEFNTIGKRLFGDEFKAGRGFAPEKSKKAVATELDFTEKPQEPAPVFATLKGLKDVPHEYQPVHTAAERERLLAVLRKSDRFALAIECSHPDPKQACLTGLAFSVEPHKAWFVDLPKGDAEKAQVIAQFGELITNEKAMIVGHDLKRALSVLRWAGPCSSARLFDTMLAHSLLEPDMRHTLQYLAESMIGYAPIAPAPEGGELNLQSDAERADKACEEADLALQLQSVLEPKLKEKQQEKVFYEIEAALIPALVEMEYEGIRVDASTLETFGKELARQILDSEKEIYALAGGEFNLNSPKQLGEVLFDRLKLLENAKKTKGGQYATNEQVLQELAGSHPIVQKILDYRSATKLKSTYVDTLPTAIWLRSGRIHTSFRQASTSTGRLASDNPNLQNIPIRTEQGREIRKAFVPRDENHLLLSADYSQIELRIIAALANEKALIEAFAQNLDIHTATAARVFGVLLPLVTADMRRKAKMVNYGLAYGMSAFGLAQRLAIPRREAAEIIDHYFTQFPGVRRYMSDTIDFTREHGYAETVTGRRRYIRDIRSSNMTVRSAAERNAINAPIQGTAADMIKIAMSRIHREICRQKLRSRMLLQVHDELVFDVYKPEEAIIRKLVEENMRTAITLAVPIVVDIGVGNNWLEAH
jgi:DNA polymerase-1